MLAKQKESTEVSCARRRVRKAFRKGRQRKLCQVTELGNNTGSMGSDSWKQTAVKVGVCGHRLIASGFSQCCLKRERKMLNDLKKDCGLGSREQDESL